MSEPSRRPRPLWAPWRIEYVRGDKPEGCFFCDKAASVDDEANFVIARADVSFALLNTYPYNSGHVMVAPLRHCGDLADLTVAERNEIMEMTVHLQRVLRAVMNPAGFNYGFNLGAPAGAGVKDHVHGHLVPRWVGDTNFMPVLNGTDVVPEALADTARALREAWRRDTQALAFAPLD